MSEPFVNKVAESGLITLDLEKYYPKGETAAFDLKDHLFMGLILKEKDFREALKKLDWSVYQDKNVALTCSADAIIPVWAWMLAVSYLQPVAKEVVMGDEKELHRSLYLKNIDAIDIMNSPVSGLLSKAAAKHPSLIMYTWRSPKSSAPL